VTCAASAIGLKAEVVVDRRATRDYLDAFPPSPSGAALSPFAPLQRAKIQGIIWLYWPRRAGWQRSRARAEIYIAAA
jgi:hypothetical protein